MFRHAQRLFLPILVLVLMIPFSPLALAQDSEQPKSVVIAGTFQAKLGCSGDWVTDCDKTALTYDKVGDVWTATFELDPGEYEYKAALNGTWDLNYGAKAEPGGANIKLSLAQKTRVMFLYSNTTHWVTDNVNSLIVTAPGSYQSEIGCSGDWQPDCLLSWMQDPKGEGKYSFVTKALLKGDYEVKAAIGQTWGENYGSGGAQGGSNIGFTVPTDHKEVYFEFDYETKLLTVNIEGAPRARTMQAHWVTRDTIAWTPKLPKGASGVVYRLHYDPNAQMVLDPVQITGGQTLPLELSTSGLGEAVIAKFPQLAKLSAFKLGADDLAKVPELLKDQLYVSAADKDGNLLDVTGLQIPGVLDDLYTYNGDLGVSVADGLPTLKVWAPTAQAVALRLFDDSKPETTGASLPMTLDAATGVWSLTGQADWLGKYYLYEVKVYAPSTNKIEQNLVTDPYSISLAMDSTRSQIVDLKNDKALKPEGWDATSKPALAAPEDIVIYELHLRDFSIADQSVPEAERGTFKAFTALDSNGMKHLEALAKAGLTHIHLLPIFDIATIEEDKTMRREVLTKLLQGFPPDSSRQQDFIANNRDKDGFNWGYDPFHYTVPEGSYSTNPDGPTRVLELREAVQALNKVGLRVVMDVVYNHTTASGQNPKSVLDKVVPGYYHRLDADGKVTTSTCCANTATEHAMMEKLMIDSVVTWAREYKIDGFRFDLMGHHMVSNMQHVRAALDALTPEKDGVDGKAIYVYGEGWNFGEVQDNALGKNATQINMAGTGIGTFNDRLRDAARGGSPFGGQQEQGFINGLFDDPNGTKEGTPEEQKARALLFMDQIRVGLAGNLKDYTFTDREGKQVTGADVKYNNGPVGYTADPQEHIVYVSAHDNETLFDIIQYKAPLATTMIDRVRMQNLGMSLVTLSQGVPFFDAGIDMLRSKSMDRNSYNSGDWFNQLDFTYQSNNWGVGLPPKADNESMWPIIGPLLANPALKPAQADILTSVNNFREILTVRKSSRLFRLETADDIKKRLTFQNVGPDQVPGLIVMTLDNRDNPIDDPYQLIVVVFNATKSDQTFTDPALVNLALQLHPVQAQSNDALVKTSRFDPATGALTVPERTTAVFVLGK